VSDKLYLSMANTQVSPNDNASALGVPFTTHPHPDLYRPHSYPTPKRILVIGGGPAGLVTFRNLLERGWEGIERVELVERRDEVGGVWWVFDFCSIVYSQNARRWLDSSQLFSEIRFV
jgi:NADPH-dependent 2,4-dienoyl-CoA reductase/sulfur reductase-like enzyme